MTHRIFPSVLFICLCSFLSDVAQGKELIRTIEKAELERLLTSYVKIKKLSGTFKQIKTIQELQTDLVSEGSLEVIKPHNITWTIHKPSFLEVKIDDKTITMTTQKGGERQTQTIQLANISSQQGAQGLSLLVPWVSLDVDKILASYEIQSPQMDFLQFYPKTPSPFKSIEMSLDKKNQIRKLKFYEKNSDTIEIIFNALKAQKSA